MANLSVIIVLSCLILEISRQTPEPRREVMDPTDAEISDEPSLLVPKFYFVQISNECTTREVKLDEEARQWSLSVAGARNSNSRDLPNYKHLPPADEWLVRCQVHKVIEIERECSVL